MSSSKSALHQAALQCAAAGIPVFPCVANGKAPASTHGFHDATTSSTIINAWWEANPNYNVAFSPQDVGLGIVDLDGPEAEEDWSKLTVTHNIPSTREVQTPRGGRHIYFDGELPQTAWRPGNERCLGRHIDTRGIGSYVLLPPSIVDGKPYKVLHDRPIANVPDWMPVALRKRNDERGSTVEKLDLAASKDRGRALLADLVIRGDVAIAGRAGNNRTYQLACELSDLGLSSELSRELLTEIWNPHCQPPWSSDELSAIIENAASYVQNERGAYAVAPADEVFSGVNLDRLLPQEPTSKPVRSRFYAEDDEEQDAAPDPVWLIPQLIPDCATVLVIGAKGSFKSFIAQEVLLALSSGVETFGAIPIRTGPTFYGAHEGRNSIKKPRKLAWKIARDVDRKLPFFVMRAPQIKDVGQCEEFREQIRVRLRQQSTKIAGIALDTVAKCMVGLNENDAGDCGLFSAFCDSLRDEFECPVIALHHYGKDAARGGRGSSALPANFDTVITVERFEKSLALSVRVDYHKDAAEPEEAFTFEGRQLGPSLVFYPTNAEEHRANTQAEDALDPRTVGAALKRLEAYGTDAAVTTMVLAAELTPQHQGEDAVAHQHRIEKTGKALVKLCRSILHPYVEKSGRDLVWLLPAKD